MSQRNRRIHYLAFWFSVLLESSLSTASDHLEENIDRLVKKAGVTASTPGVGVLVINHGDVLIKKGYGLANIKERTPIHSETTFEIASTSKTLTSVGICRLHDQDRLQFDDPVRKYVPELPADNEKNPLRISHLLQHTSGLPDYLSWPEPEGRHARYADNEDYVQLMAKQPKLVKRHFPVGAKYEYSNTNFLLLAVIAARITNQSFGTFMHHEIFKPVGMKQTWIYERPGSHRKHPTLGDVNALGYVKNDKGKWEVGRGSPPFRDETDLTCGDGSVWTSLDDMVHWDQAIRRGNLVKPATWGMAMAPSKTMDGKTNEYGYGWGLFFNEDHKLSAFGHNGTYAGFRSSYWRYTPAWRNDSLDLTVILLSNRGDLGTGSMADDIYDAIDAVKKAP